MLSIIHNGRAGYKLDNLAKGTLALHLILETLNWYHKQDIPLRYNFTKDMIHIYMVCVLTHLGRDKIDTIFQTTFSNAISWMKMFEFRLKLHWTMFLKVQLTIFQHWFRQLLGAEQATSHYLNQCWPSSTMHICVTRPQRVDDGSPIHGSYSLQHCICRCSGFVSDRNHKQIPYCSFHKSLYLNCVFTTRSILTRGQIVFFVFLATTVGNGSSYTPHNEVIQFSVD